MDGNHETFLVSELDAAATKLQKVCKGYRTRCNLAEAAVVVEELWWKAVDFAALKQGSISFFDSEENETAVSRWTWSRTRAAKIGKGLCKDEKPQILAPQYWLEAIDLLHRCGDNLQLYREIWSDCIFGCFVFILLLLASSFVYGLYSVEDGQDWLLF
ncbi:hypothetical protein ACFX2I_042921 [Malus domestica]